MEFTLGQTDGNIEDDGIRVNNMVLGSILASVVVCKKSTVFGNSGSVSNG